MKRSAQILLLLVLFSLYVITFSAKVTVTKSFSTKKSYHSSKGNSGNGHSSGGNSGSGSGSNNGGSGSGSEPINPGADSFHACDANNRPEACTFEYNPVCGYIHECEGGSCTSTFGNDCTACSNSNVDGYVQGACEDVQTVCDPDNRPEVCTLIYTATCAVAANCEGPYCFENTSSSCVACSMDGAAYSLPGVCPGGDKSSERVYCDPNNRPEICTLDYRPVCAHQASCVGDACYSTAGNACGACAEANVDFYYPDGECADDGDNRTYCDPNNRPEVCTLEYNPVCAHFSDCSGDNCTKTAGNDCSACGTANVSYWTPGEC